MKDIITTFISYCGDGILPVLFLIAMIYLLITEKDKKVRIVLVESSLIILVLFFFPLFKLVMDKVEEAGTYYRILWLLPMTIVTAYAGVKLIGKHTRIGLAALTAVCILCGNYVYNNVHISKAENRYHIPAVVVNICDAIQPAEDEERIWAVFPSELLHFVRQYSSDVQLIYGRDMMVASWDHVEHPIYALMEAETVQVELLAELLNDYNCQYVILNENKKRAGEPTEFHLEKVAEFGAYDVYRNTDVPVLKKADPS